MNVRLPKTVKELYTLVDKCARMEEGRKLPGEEDCINVDSEETIPKGGNYLSSRARTSPGAPMIGAPTPTPAIATTSGDLLPRHQISFPLH